MTIRRLLLPSLSLAALASGCGKDEGTAPPRPLTMRVVASLPATHPEGPLGAIAEGRVSLQPRPGNATAIGLMAAPQGDSIAVSWTGVLPGGSTGWYVAVSALAADGSTLFAGEDSVRIARGDSLVVVRPAMRYVGSDSALATLRLATRDTMLAAFDSVRLGIAGFRADGAPLAPVRVAWHSRDTSVATVDANGWVRARGLARAAWIVARGWNGVADSIRVASAGAPATILVTTGAAPADSVTLARGDTVALAAVVRDAAGTTLPGHAVSWNVADASVATVTPDGRVVARVGDATTRVVASLGALADTIVVVTRRRPVGRVVVTPATGTIAVGDSLQMMATVLDDRGEATTEHAVAWHVADTAATSITASGVVRGTMRGRTAAVRAVAGGAGGQARLSVTRPGAAHATPWLEFNSSGNVPVGTDSYDGTIRCRAPDGQPEYSACFSGVGFRTLSGYPGWADARSDNRIIPYGGFYMIYRGVTPGRSVIVAESQGFTPDTLFAEVYSPAQVTSAVPGSALRVGDTTVVTVTFPALNRARTVVFDVVSYGVLMPPGDATGRVTVPAGATSASITLRAASPGTTRVTIRGDGLLVAAPGEYVVVASP